MLRNKLFSCCSILWYSFLNTFKPELTVAIFIHYQPRICFRNFRPVVDEDELKWVANERNMLLLRCYY